VLNFHFISFNLIKFYLLLFSIEKASALRGGGGNKNLIVVLLFLLFTTPPRRGGIISIKMTPSIASTPLRGGWQIEKGQRQWLT
jgi:hypothetical protein